MAKVSIQNTDISFNCGPGDTVLRSALRAGISIPYSCNVGSCGNCRVGIIKGQVEHLRKDAPAWTERDRKRAKYLACQAVPDGPCTIEFRFNAEKFVPIRPAKFDAILTKKNAITWDITEFHFEPIGAPSFLPGQYALFYIEGVDGARPYSMCNLPLDDDWAFQIKRVQGGACTKKLFDMKTGQKIKMDGPYSSAYLKKDTSRDIILVAGGSGLSPMVSIARGAFTSEILDNQNLHFYYGCKSKLDIFDPDVVFGELKNKISFNTVLSNADSPIHRSGFLHDALREDFGVRLKNYDIYFAGPPAMVAEMQKITHELGVPFDQIHFDEFL